MITLQCKLPIQNLKEVLTELRLLNTSSCTYTRTALILWTLCFTTKTIHSLTILKTLTIPFIFSFGDHTPALKKIAFRFFYLQTNTPHTTATTNTLFASPLLPLYFYATSCYSLITQDPLVPATAFDTSHD